jgi:glyoxylase-like metal-dependent hydrolase (beta-lactamase superfamily II)
VATVIALSLDDVVPLPLTTVTFPSFHPLSGQLGVVNAFAVRHPDGVILIDTGIGEGNAFVEQAYRPQRRVIAAELRAVGLDINEVVAVINGHLHFDNIGGNGLFPGVPIFVQEAEWDLAHSGGDTYRAERVDFDVLDWIEFPGATYDVVNGEHEVLPGVRLLPTPGHTPGHQAVLVETDEGLAVVAGQLPYDHVEWEWIRTERSLPAAETDDPPHNIVIGDPVTYLASALGLVDLDPRSVHFTHDPTAWRKRD